MYYWLLASVMLLPALSAPGDAACLACDDLIFLGPAEQACFRTAFANEGLPAPEDAPRRYDLADCLAGRQGLDRGGVVTMPDLTSRIAGDGASRAKTAYVLDHPYAACLARIIPGLHGRSAAADLTRICP